MVNNLPIILSKKNRLQKVILFEAGLSEKYKAKELDGQIGTADYYERFKMRR